MKHHASNNLRILLEMRKVCGAPTFLPLIHAFGPALALQLRIKHGNIVISFPT